MLITTSFRASLVAQMVKRPPAMRETWVRSLGWEDPLEKGMATHSSLLAWRIPWTEDPDRLQSMGSQRVGHDFTFTFLNSKLWGPKRYDPAMFSPEATLFLKSGTLPK